MLAAAPIEFHHPEVILPTAGFALISRGPGQGGAQQQIAPVRGLLDRAQLFIGTPPHGGIPLFAAAGPELDDPIIILALAALRFVAAWLGRRIARGQVAPIRSLLQRLQLVKPSSAQGFVPLLAALRIQFDEPVIITAATGFGFLARDTRAGRPADEAPAVAGRRHGP
ncbi:hypothetical protein [Hymenobacter sp. HDW8]|uniref:hypothetical protein n=1 Tax=Hymenobacter sp. HDW8 TaxID=2714932 RepID=UPI0014088C8E|nr:hypothetical protein [Hymenobacter sp. HDW8]QIL78145.1 hypothetical protein G7064_20155 [Hymenobacter sp. HDW8]